MRGCWLSLLRKRIAERVGDQFLLGGGDAVEEGQGERAARDGLGEGEGS